MVCLVCRSVKCAAGIVGIPIYLVVSDAALSGIFAVDNFSVAVNNNAFFGGIIVGADDGAPVIFAYSSLDFPGFALSDGDAFIAGDFAYGVGVVSGVLRKFCVYRSQCNIVV